jgi:hypothetical protein
MTERLFYLVFSNPVAEDREEEFHQWYDEVHLPEVLATPGFISAQRIGLRRTEFARATEPAQRFGVLYEVEGDPEEVMGRVSAGVAAGTIHMSDVLDLSTFQMAFWSPRGEKLLASLVRTDA